MTPSELSSAAEQVEHLDWHTLIHAKSDTSPEIIKALDEYFAPFAQPPGETKDGKFHVKDGHPCLKCGEALTGLASMLIGSGGFRWGLAHGEGNCSKCGWPARMYHFIKDDKGEELMTVRGFLLQYHPDAVTMRGKRSA